MTKVLNTRVIIAGRSTVKDLEAGSVARARAVKVTALMLI